MKIGGVKKVINNGRNLFVEFDRVEYAQIGYIVISQRRYEGKTIDLGFYDVEKYVDGVLG